MKRLTMIVFLILIMSGCNAINHSANDDKSKPAFFNETTASDAKLFEQWTIAQHTIAENPSDMNVVTRLSNPGLPVVTIPADPRALSIFPHGVRVVPVPDLPISQLISRDPRWATHTDPSGVIDCGGVACHSFVDLNSNTVYAATSIIPQVLEWEFENIILNSLGYDIDGR